MSRRYDTGFDWTDEKIALLRALWAENDVSAAEIGRRMGISKNAVVGKVHRLKLPARPSPIKHTSGPRKPRASRARAATLPGVPAVELSTRVRPATLPVVVPPTQVSRPCRSEPCCYPIGTPGHVTFRFCDEPSEPGRPYCSKHRAICYVRARDHLEDCDAA